VTTVSTTATRATMDDWTRFMRPIAMSVRNIPAEDDFRARVAAIAHAVAIPAAWLRQPWRQAEAMRRWQFWPSVADVAELFADDLRAERETASRRQPVALPPPSAATFRTPEEILAVQQKAREVIADLTGNGAKPERAPPRPMPLSDGALLALYEAMGDAGKHRAAVLRRKMAAAGA
jgi:hypothetical protein